MRKQNWLRKYRKKYYYWFSFINKAHSMCFSIIQYKIMIEQWRGYLDLYRYIMFILYLNICKHLILYTFTENSLYNAFSEIYELLKARKKWKQGFISSVNITWNLDNVYAIFKKQKSIYRILSFGRVRQSMTLTEFNNCLSLKKNKTISLRVLYPQEDTL